MYSYIVKVIKFWHNACSAVTNSNSNLKLPASSTKSYRSLEHLTKLLASLARSYDNVWMPVVSSWSDSSFVDEMPISHNDRLLCSFALAVYLWRAFQQTSGNWHTSSYFLMCCMLNWVRRRWAFLEKTWRQLLSMKQISWCISRPENRTQSQWDFSMSLYCLHLGKCCQRMVCFSAQVLWHYFPNRCQWTNQAFAQSNPQTSVNLKSCCQIFLDPKWMSTFKSELRNRNANTAYDSTCPARLLATDEFKAFVVRGYFVGVPMLHMWCLEQVGRDSHGTHTLAFGSS